MTEAALMAFLLVFVRASGMLLVAPMFGATNTPLPVRILTTLSLAGALTVAIRPKLGPIPASMHELIMAVVVEAGAGLLLGSMVSLAMQALSIAGSLADLQTGLSMSQVMNPLNGVQTTVLTQFKTMLALVTFLAADAHHLLIASFVKSYDAIPTLERVHTALIPLLTKTFILGIQVAAPVMAIGFLVDAALALVSRAVPTIQPSQLGLPAKLIGGLLAVSIGLPSMVAAVSVAVRMAITATDGVFTHV